MSHILMVQLDKKLVKLFKIVGTRFISCALEWYSVSLIYLFIISTAHLLGKYPLSRYSVLDIAEKECLKQLFLW